MASWMAGTPQWFQSAKKITPMYPYPFFLCANPTTVGNCQMWQYFNDRSRKQFADALPTPESLPEPQWVVTSVPMPTKSENRCAASWKIAWAAIFFAAKFINTYILCLFPWDGEDGGLWVVGGGGK